MPKGLNVSKAIDKAAGALGTEGVGFTVAGYSHNKKLLTTAPSKGYVPPAPATDAAREWDGWNSAIKPAVEPVCVARKPFKGTIVNNVLTHGTGAYHVDACRIPASPDDPNTRDSTDHINDHHGIGYSGGWKAIARRNPQEFGGRWPANVCMDEAAAAVLDAMSGERPGDNRAIENPGRRDSGFLNVGSGNGSGTPNAPVYADRGGASRFFYTAKASQAERNIGHAPGERCNHPTVKPIDLMQWLVRLVTPPGGIVLDPFMGSGSTGIACAREGFQFIGIDIDPHNVATARKRIVGDAPLFASVAD
jgi:site-specific DNA-methyltransferase (adenine-specific)